MVFFSIILVFLWHVYAVPTLYAQSGGSTASHRYVGGLTGSFALSATGGATYTVPLDVPVGVGGMQPSVSIVYNSQSGNGIVGWGTAIAGMSAITRAPKDIYHDEEAAGVEHTVRDAFYLDGQRLIHDAETSGGDVMVYHLETDPLTTVTMHAAHSTHVGDIWFEVESSNGMRYRYGTNSSTQQRYYYGSNYVTRVGSWLLEYAEDPQGNFIEYDYHMWDYFVYPARITYGQNKNQANALENTIRFEYEMRNDVTSFTLGSTKGKMDRRLYTISSYTNGELYRRYVFQYNATADAGDAKFSRLVRITPQNGDLEELESLKLEWNYMPSAQQSMALLKMEDISSANPNFFDKHYTAADFNGDGLTDIVGVAPDMLFYTYYARMGNNGKVIFTMDKSSKLDPMPYVSIGRNQYQGIFALDINGNGINEQVVAHITNYPSMPQNIDNSGINAQGTEHMPKYPSMQQATFYFYDTLDLLGSLSYELKGGREMPLYATGDFNKDGRGDIICLEKVPYQQNRYAGGILGYKKNKKLHEAWYNFSLPANPERLFVADFDGDGLEDIIVLYEGGYTIFWNKGKDITEHTFSDNYKTIGTNLSANHRWVMVRTGDFNGDGLTDFIQNATNQNEWYFFLNNGDGTFTSSVACRIWLHDQSLTDKDEDKFTVLVYDFDGDGKSDVVMSKSMYWEQFILFWGRPRFDKTYTYWMRSDGEKLVEVKKSISDREDDAHPYRHLLGDFNGDGTVDMINLGYDCYNSVHANEGPLWRYYSNYITPASGKVARIIEGTGATRSLTYASLANDAFYTKDSATAYPLIDDRLPIHAVKSTHLYNNGTADRENISYTYQGLKLHMQGKGMLGFSQQTMKNHTTGITTKSGVSGWDNRFYIPLTTYTQTQIDNKVAETKTTFKIVDKSNKQYFAHPLLKEETSLDFVTTTTHYKFNPTYGYLEQEKVLSNTSMWKMVNYDNYIRVRNVYKPQQITHTQKHEDDENVFVRKTGILYDLATGLKLQVIENKDTPLALTTDYTYDVYGNVLNTRQSGAGVAPMTKHTVYDATHRFLRKTYTTPATFVTNYDYDKWGNLLSETDATQLQNPLTTTYTYDRWGNLLRIKHPDGAKTEIQKGWENYSRKSYFVRTQKTGAPWEKIIYDNQGRVIRKESIGSKEMPMSIGNVYNSLGQLVHKTSRTGDRTLTEYYTYDGRGRLTTHSSSAGSNTTYTYGVHSVVTHTNGKRYEKVYDSWGGLRISTDAEGSVTYRDGSLGQPVQILPSASDPAISMVYDAVGNKIELSDPNAGTTSYVYDALGRVIEQTNANGKTIRTQYDDKGRVSVVYTDGVPTRYRYGNAGYEQEQLVSIEKGNTSVTYAYDAYGRVAYETRLIEQDTLSFKYIYNIAGQPDSILYPDSVLVINHYDRYGYLERVSAEGKEVWSLSTATGSHYTALVGGNMTSTQTYNQEGFLTQKTAYTSARYIHNMQFAFDVSTGNLTTRTGMLPVTETFVYDPIDRLTQVQHDNYPVLSMQYASNGNMLSKSDVGTYQYGRKPHAVAGLESTASLNLHPSQQIDYTAFNKVSRISEQVAADTTYVLDFLYGPDLQPWKTTLQKNGVAQRTTLFAQDYERVIEDGKARHLHYIAGGNGVVAIYVREAGVEDKIYYPHTDNLGSIVKLTTETGEEVFSASYDVWGQRTVTNNTFPYHRGFTGHEHIDIFGLIDMNGRMYDPLLGRFLSPDPYVQQPDFSQNYNRYSYCWNNPLKYTDPSGEWIEWVLFSLFLFTTDIGYEVQKYISPVAFKIDIKFGTHQKGLGFDVSLGVPKVLPYAYRADAGATYFWKSFGDYKGWETRTGHEQSILGLFHWGETNYQAGEFTQTTGFVSFGMPHLYGVTVSNDLFGDKGDRFRTSHQRVDFFGLSIGNSVFTGDPGLIDDDEHRKTIAEPRARSGKVYVPSLYGDPDKYRHGIFYVGIGPFQLGWDNEDIRHFFQNIIGHNFFSKESPWFKYIHRSSSPYIQFRGGWR